MFSVSPHKMTSSAVALVAQRSEPKGVEMVGSPADRGVTKAELQDSDEFGSSVAPAGSAMGSVGSQDAPAVAQASAALERQLDIDGTSEFAHTGLDKEQQIGEVKKQNLPSGICQHGRQRSRCKDCDGSGICEHRRLRHYCKQCGGSGICEHGRRKSDCKPCQGSSICEHGKQKRQCKECLSIYGRCEHGKAKNRFCRECGHRPVLAPSPRARPTFQGNLDSKVFHAATVPDVSSVAALPSLQFVPGISGAAPQLDLRQFNHMMQPQLPRLPFVSYGPQLAAPLNSLFMLPLMMQAQQNLLLAQANYVSQSQQQANYLQQQQPFNTLIEMPLPSLPPSCPSFSPLILPTNTLLRSAPPITSNFPMFGMQSFDSLQQHFGGGRGA